MPRARRLSLAVVALVAAMAVLAGAVGARRHVSVEMHAPCAQGGAVHVERVSEELAIATSETGPLVAAPIWWRVDGDPHCTTASPSPCLDAARPALFVSVAIGWNDTPAPAARASTAGAIYRLAPKTSPPIARA